MCLDWKREFLSLYTSYDLERSREAFELKREHIPAKLFRYRDLCSDNIEYRKREIAGELFLSHPQKLNDPFECWSFLHSKTPIDYVNKFTYVDYYLKTGKTGEAHAILQSDNWYETLLELQTSGENSPEKKDGMKKAIENSIMIAMEDINKEVRNRIIEMVRLACFSTTATNLPMWYHYTDKRKGICLEYSPSDIEDQYQLNSLFPVHYVDRLPDMTHMLAHKEKASLSMPTFLSFHKLKDWEYEHEWRIIYDVGYWIRKGIPLPDNFQNGVAINFIKPSKVILGTDIETQMEHEITTCAAERGIPVVKSRFTEYGLAVE